MHELTFVHKTLESKRQYFLEIVDCLSVDRKKGTVEIELIVMMVVVLVLAALAVFVALVVVVAMV